MTEDYTSLRQIVWRHFKRHCVAWKYAYEIQAHLSGNVREYAVTVFQLYAEHCIRKKLLHNTVKAERIVFLTVMRLRAVGRRRGFRAVILPSVIGFTLGHLSKPPWNLRL